MIHEIKLRQFLVEQLIKLRRAAVELVSAGHEPPAAERVLQHRYERLRAVLDAVPAWIAYVDADQRYRFCNRRYAQIHGRSPGALNGRRVRDVIGRTAYDRARPNIEAALAGRTVADEMPFGTDSRERERHVHASYVPDVVEDGSVRGFVALVLDISERKRAELILAASERRWRSVFEAACVGMAIVDTNGRLLESNPALRHFLGANGAELHAARWVDLAYDRDRERSARRFRQLIEGRRSDYRLEQRYVRRDDRAIVWGDTAVAAVPDDGGAVAYAVPMVMDTTGHRKAQEALSVSEARSRQILDAAPDAMVVVDRDGRITMANAQASAMFGYRREELIGQPVELLIPDRLRTRHAQLHERYVTRPRTRPMGAGIDLRARRKDGSELPVEVSLSPADTTDGLLVIAAIRDVTERKEAEVALRASQAAYRDLVMHATYGIYRTDREGTVLAANPAMAEMLGCDSVDELLGVQMSRFYLDPAEREALIERHGTRETIRDIETKWRRKDGRTITVRLNGRTIRDEGGRLRGFEVIVEDVTERRRLEAQLRQAQKMEAVGRLAGGVAHDFNNMLTAILGVTDLMLLDQAPDDPRRPDLLEIRDAASRAAALTTQLLAFSRQQVLSPRRLDLNALVTNAERLLKRVIGEHIQVKAELDPTLATVEADPAQLEQVLLNLAVNARDAMPNGGTLTIATTNAALGDAQARRDYEVKPGRYVVLTVTDTGVGMDRDTQTRLFEPFFTTKTAGRGTGLGLATVYGIVKQSGGYIWVDSAPGEGTTFRIYLPRVDGPVENVGADPEQLLPGGTETILLVEDEETVRRLARRTLAGRGYTVLLAAHGQEALRLFREHEAEIDLIVTDLVMPEMGGERLREALRAAGKRVRWLFVSGYSERDWRTRGTAVRELPFLQKPWTVTSLLQKVRQVLDSTEPV